MRGGGVFLIFLGGVTAGASAAASSKLAPTLSYAGKTNSVHAFLHSYDALPKVLLLKPTAAEPAKSEEEGGGPTAAKAGEPPSWFTSVAVAFKDGRKKSVSFAMIEGEDAKKVAMRFGISGDFLEPRVVGCTVDGKSGGSFALYDGYLGDSAGKTVREVRTFVRTMIDGTESGEPLPMEPLPAFPPPDVPRKSVAISLTELTHDNLPTHCFGGAKSLCVLALLPRGAEACPDAFKALATRHRNDPIQFVWLKTRGQEEFVAAFGVEAGQLPQLVAVRSGKRSRFALGEGGLDSGSMGAFVDNILGGGATFKKLSELPELTPPYLMEPEEKAEL